MVGQLGQRPSEGPTEAARAEGRRRCWTLFVGSDRVGGMSTETTTVDPVKAILEAAFGPGIAAGTEVTQKVEKDIVYVKAPNGTTYRELEVPALKLDGTPRKRTQRVQVTLGFGAEARREASEALVVEALLKGDESIADIQRSTGLAKLTIKRVVRRLESLGRVISSKAQSGKRGRPAFLYRPAVTIEPQRVKGAGAVSDTGEVPSSRPDPVSGDDRGI